MRWLWLIFEANPCLHWISDSEYCNKMKRTAEHTCRHSVETRWSLHIYSAAVSAQLYRLQNKCYAVKFYIPNLWSIQERAQTICRWLLFLQNCNHKYAARATSSSLLLSAILEDFGALQVSCFVAQLFWLITVANKLVRFLLAVWHRLWDCYRISNFIITFCYKHKI